MDASSHSSKPTRRQRPPNTAPPNQGPHSIAPGFRPLHARAASNPTGPWRAQPNSAARFDERSPLARSYSTADIEGVEESLNYKGSGPVAGGTVMGIHNLAIVFPQFIVSSWKDTQLRPEIALVASFIFRLADAEPNGKPTGEYVSKNSVAWVLRFGGLMALVCSMGRFAVTYTLQVGALICRKVPPTKTEKAGAEYLYGVLLTKSLGDAKATSGDERRERRMRSSKDSVLFPGKLTGAYYEWSKLPWHAISFDEPHVTQLSLPGMMFGLRYSSSQPSC